MSLEAWPFRHWSLGLELFAACSVFVFQGVIGKATNKALSVVTASSDAKHWHGEGGLLQLSVSNPNYPIYCFETYCSSAGPLRPFADYPPTITIPRLLLFKISEFVVIISSVPQAQSTFSIMCYFRRLVYDHCSHVKFLGPDPVRKCHLQLAYECGETEVPCGKMIEHSYMSIKVDESCKTCAVKINKSQSTLSTIRNQLAMAKLKLRIPLETLEDHDTGEDEALSPVDVSFGLPDLMGPEGGRGIAKGL